MTAVTPWLAFQEFGILEVVKFGFWFLGGRCDLPMDGSWDPRSPWNCWVRACPGPAGWPLEAAPGQGARPSGSFGTRRAFRIACA